MHHSPKDQILNDVMQKPENDKKKINLNQFVSNSITEKVNGENKENISNV